MNINCGSNEKLLLIGKLTHTPAENPVSVLYLIPDEFGPDTLNLEKLAAPSKPPETV